ncbi:hypothetical protein D3C75_132290 [compost metagenome]
MTPEREEERALRAYFAEVEIGSEEQAVPDWKLDGAVRAGIERGRQRRLPSLRWRAGIIMAAAALLVLVLLPWLTGLAGQTVPARKPLTNWGDLEPFREILKNQISPKTALDYGEVYRIGAESEEKNGYRFKVDAVIADQRGMFVLYTTENENDQKAQIAGFVLKDQGTGKSIYASYTSWGDMENGKGRARHIIQVTWDRAVQKIPASVTATLTMTENSPEALTSSSMKYRTELVTSFRLDGSGAVQEGEDIPLNSSMVIGGQEIYLSKAYIGPTGIYVDYDYKDSNSMKIFGLISPVILSEKDGEATELASWLSYGGDIVTGTMVFGYDNGNERGPLTLTVDGIQALDKGRLSLVVDTEKKEILKAPDSKLKFSEVPAAKGQMVLSYSEPGTSGGNNPWYSLSLDGDYMDGKGEKHKLDSSHSEVSHREDADGRTADYYINLGAPSEDLPQPLTFTLDSYPSPVLEHKSLRIR